MYMYGCCIYTMHFYHLPLSFALFLQLNNAVSGALDRLHYEKDPCVRYINSKKLWIYLHRGRTEEEFGKCSERVMTLLEVVVCSALISLSLSLSLSLSFQSTLIGLVMLR